MRKRATNAHIRIFIFNLNWMLAVIKTGGKQYVVKEGDKLKVEKIDGKVGAKAEFSDVLAVGDDQEIQLGTPQLKSAKVEAKIIRQDKAKKVTIIKHKAKKRYKKKQGHRQFFSEVEITKIG